MTPEDRLRRLLRDHDDVPIAGDGMTRIRARVDNRARAARFLVPAASLAGVVSIAAGAALVLSTGDDGDLRPIPGTRPTESTPPSTQPSPSASPSSSPSGVTTSAEGVPIWPFASDAQAAQWRTSPGGQDWAADPVQVAQHLLDDFLQLPGRATRRVDSDPALAVVELSAAGRPVAQVRLVRVGRDPGGPWSVTHATSDDVSISTPADGSRIGSRVAVTGSVSGVDESVRVRLLTGTGAQLAEGFAAAGQEQPWSQPLRWTSTAWDVGGLVASTFDGKGDLRAIALTAVRRGGPTGQSSAGLVAIESGHVVLADPANGQTRRQLSYPPAGTTDSDPARSGTDAVWVRTAADGCSTSIIGLGLADGTARVEVGSAARRRLLPSLSDDGRTLAWVERGCDAGPAQSVVVRGPDGQLSTAPVTDGPVTALDVRDDGAVLAAAGEQVYLLAAGRTSVAADRRLRGAAGCAVTAPAWDGAVAIAWEQCPNAVRLARFDPDGEKASSSGVVTESVLRTSVSAGAILVVLADGSPATWRDGRLTRVPDGSRLMFASW